MADFKTSFRKGELAREIALRGLSQKDFAERASLAPATILRADRGERLLPATWGRILITLGSLSVAEIPQSLVEQSA